MSAVEALLLSTAAGVLWVLRKAIRHVAQKRSAQRRSVLEPNFELEVTSRQVDSKIGVVLLPLSCTAAEAILGADRDLAHACIVGLDSEWQPKRQKGQHSPVALLQLCAGSKCYLAQLLHMDDVPSQLRYILENPLVIKVGVGIGQDVRRLLTDYAIRVTSAVDLRDVIRTVQPDKMTGSTSLAALSRTLLGVEVDKTMQCSDWGSVQLTKPQLAYAAMDAWISLQLAQQLQAQLLARGTCGKCDHQQQHGCEQQQQQWQQQEQGHLSMPAGHTNSSTSNSSADMPATQRLATGSVALHSLLLPFALQQSAESTPQVVQLEPQQLIQHPHHQQHQQQLQNGAQSHVSIVHSSNRSPKLPARHQHHHVGPIAAGLQPNAAQNHVPIHQVGPLLHTRKQQQQQQTQQQQQQVSKAAAVVLRLRYLLPMLPQKQLTVLLWQAAWALLWLQRVWGRQRPSGQHGPLDHCPYQQQEKQQQQQMQQQDSARGPANPLTAPGAQEQRQQQQHQQQQQQQQLARLGLHSHRPQTSIYDRLQQLKPARMPTRKCLQYENCRILSPQGVGLATCGVKKIRWYLDRDLAELVNESPPVIRLKFTPKGSGHADDAYYLSDKVNQCVVCGHTGEYLRHSIVPHTYRSHFPAHMKSHLSHDIVLMCPGCHQIANMAAHTRMQELGQHYGAPLEDASKRFETDKPLSAVRSAAKALAGKAAARIPPARVHQLRAVILQHFGRETEPWPASLSEQQQLLQVALAVEVKSAAEGWQPHAAVVVAGVLAEGEQLQQQQQGGADYSHGAPASGSCPLAKEQRTSTQHRAQPSTAAAAAAGAAADSAESAAALLSAAVACDVGAGAVVAAASASALGLQAAVHGALQAVCSTGQQEQQQQGHHTPLLLLPPHNHLQQQECQDTQVQQHQHSWSGTLSQQQVHMVAPADLASIHSSVAAAASHGFQTMLLAMAAAACVSLATIGDHLSSSPSSSNSNSNSSCCSATSQAPVQGAPRPPRSQCISSTQHAQAGAIQPSCMRMALRTTTGQGTTATAAANVPAAAAEHSATHPAAVGGAVAKQQQQQQLSAAGEAALEEFVKGWRRHFLDTMQPQYLPSFWSVDSRVKNSSAPTHAVVPAAAAAAAAAAAVAWHASQGFPEDQSS